MRAMTARPPSPTHPPWRGLPAGLLIAVFGLSLIGAAWVDTLHRGSADREAEIARVHQENDTLARAFEEHVRRVVGDADELLTNLKLEYEKAGRVTGEMAALIERSKGDPSLNQIAVTDARGTLVLSAVPLDRPINISQNETYKTLSTRADDGLLIARPIKTQASGTWSFFVARRLNARDGRFAGIVTAGLNPDYFSRFYEGLGLDPDRAVLLVGRDGIVRARRFQKQTEVGQDLSGSPMFRRMEREPAGHHEVVGTIDKLRRFASYRALSDYPLVVAVSELASTALAPAEWRAAAGRGVALLFSIFVAASCVVLIVADRRTQRRNDELAVELAERHRAEEALRESQDLFAAFLDHVPAVVFVQDLLRMPDLECVVGRNAPGKI